MSENFAGRCGCCVCQGKHCLMPHPGHSHADAEERIANLYEMLAESVESMTDEEIIEECRASGEDPEKVAEHTRALLQRTFDEFQARKKSEASRG